MPFCNQCGHENPAGSRFCARCGEPLKASDGDAGPDTTSLITPVEDTGVTDALTDEDQASIRALPEGSALLVVHHGPNQGNRILLQHDTEKIGRHPDSDIFLDDITVSRHHATLSRAADGTWTVTDGGSLNGTYLRKKMLDGPGQLRNGDELQVGKFRFLFYAGNPG